MATRTVVRDDYLAAIGLAASTRTCNDLIGSGKKTRLLDVLVFVERLQQTGHVSGFFNVVTENRCEMDFYSQFHSVFCILAGSSGQNEAHITPAFMTSGLLVHPPYGPGAWSCILPSKRSKVQLSLVDPVRWQRPLQLRLRLQAVPEQKYRFAVCPQPLYRLEAHRDLLEEWLDYHKDMGVEHWTIYDLDGSGAPALSHRKDVDFFPHLPSILQSPRLAEGNWWNLGCLGRQMHLVAIQTAHVHLYILVCFCTHIQAFVYGICARLRTFTHTHTHTRICLCVHLFVYLLNM